MVEVVVVVGVVVGVGVEVGVVVGVVVGVGVGVGVVVGVGVGEHSMTGLAALGIFWLVVVLWLWGALCVLERDRQERPDRWEDP